MDEFVEETLKTAEIAKFTNEQILNYEDSLKTYRDLKNSIDTAREEGIEEGIGIGVEKTTLDIAENAINAGLSNEMIKTITKLGDSKIDEIRRGLQ